MVKSLHSKAMMAQARLCLAMVALFFCALSASAQTTVSALGRAADGSPLYGSLALEQTNSSVFNIDYAVNGDETRLAIFVANLAASKRASQTAIQMYSLPDGTLLWTQAVGLDDIQMHFHRNNLLVNNARQMQYLDGETGALKWKKTGLLVHVNDSLDVLCCYKNQTSNALNGLRISTGEELWKGSVPHDRNWGWDEAMLLNDSTDLLLLNNQITRLSLTTGNTTTIPSKMGIANTKQIWADIGIGVVAGLTMGAVGAMTGAYFVPYPTHGYGDSHVIHGIRSNLLALGDSLYVSDRQSITSFGCQAQVHWQTALPTHTATKAFIFATDSLIGMYNTGFGIQYNGTTRNCGKPFLAFFNRQTGQQTDFLDLSDTLFPVYKAVHQGNHLLLLGEKQLALADLQQKRFVTEGVAAGGWERVFNAVRGTVYVEDAATQTVWPVVPDSTHFAVLGRAQDATETMLALVDTALNVVDYFPGSNLFIPLDQSEPYRFIYNAIGEVLCVDADHKIVSQYSFPDSAVLTRRPRYLYAGTRKGVYIVQLSDLLPRPEEPTQEESKEVTNTDKITLQN